MMVIIVIAYFLSFFVIWQGAGLIIRAVNRISHRFDLSAFSVSFFVLGLLTSVPETFVGISSVVKRDPEIFVGNLLGGIIVIFLLIIPILAIVGNGIKLNHQMNTRNLLFTLIVVIAPFFLITDKKITLFEAVFLIALYAILIYLIEKRKSLLERIQTQFIHNKLSFGKDIGMIILGVIMVLVSSNYLVEKTILFGQILKISPFVISLIVLSLGTNLPELSLAIKSVVSRKKEVAFGDYVGSAAANTLLMGGLTLLNGGQVTVVNHFIRPFIFALGGLMLFFFFSRSRNNISRQEGLILLLVYIIFLISEMV